MAMGLRPLSQSHFPGRRKSLYRRGDPVITKACYLGLISGFPDGTFRPDIPITRGDNFQNHRQLPVRLWLSL